MDPEVRELATAAVTALQTIAANSSPHWTDVAGVGVALVVGGTQCGLIAWGIRVMHDSNLTRESRHTEVMAAFSRQHEEAQRRHEERQLNARASASTRKLNARPSVATRKL